MRSTKINQVFPGPNRSGATRTNPEHLIRERASRSGALRTYAQRSGVWQGHRYRGRRCPPSTGARCSAATLICRASAR